MEADDVAYPIFSSHGEHFDRPGLTKREWLLGQALAGAASGNFQCPEDAASWAVRCTGALLRELQIEKDEVA